MIFHNDIIFLFCFNVLPCSPVNLRITRTHKGKEDDMTTWDTIDITDFFTQSYAYHTGWIYTMYYLSYNFTKELFDHINSLLF